MSPAGWAPNIGLIARMDLIEADGRKVTPVDYKRGRAPDVSERAWEPECVQLCAQALILEENGYEVERGILYFVRAVHHALMGAGVWIIEGLDLTNAPIGPCDLVCLPLKIVGADGAPGRAIIRPTV